MSGARRDSATYVRMKKKACTEIGIDSFGTDFEATVTQEELIAKIDELNASKYLSSILSQLFFAVPNPYIVVLFCSLSTLTNERKQIRPSRERHPGAAPTTRPLG